MDIGLPRRRRTAIVFTLVLASAVGLLGLGAAPAAAVEDTIVVTTTIQAAVDAASAWRHRRRSRRHVP